MPRKRPRYRRSARHIARFACQVVRERDFRLVADRVLNLSPGGLLVGPADSVLTGENVIVSFENPRGGWVDAEATVVRVAHGRRPGDFGRCLGLRFGDLDLSSSLTVKRLMKETLAAPPGARRDRRTILRPWAA
jgi:hypothetical protein